MKKCEGTQILVCLPGGVLVLSGEASSAFGASSSHHASRGGLPGLQREQDPAPVSLPDGKGGIPGKSGPCALAKAPCLQYGMTTSKETSARAMSSVLMKGKGLEELFV
jgi:hypothetical protein